MTFKQQLVLYFIAIFALSCVIVHQLHVALPQKSKPYILCTTTIIADVIKNIGNDSIDVICLMGPGIDPHLYKPVESDLLKIASADIIFYHGLHLEAKMADLFNHLAKKQTSIAITQDIPKNMLLAVDNYDQIFDPHVWFDINLWIYAIRTISNTLIENFPEHADLYRANTQNYILELQNLLLQTQSIMDTIPKKNRFLITGHDAFSYFGRLYDCKVIGLQGISTESSPGAFDIAKIIQLICDQNIPAIFIESSIPIKNIVAIEQGVAAAGKRVTIGGQLYSDALDTPGSSCDTYITMFLHNVKTIASALTLAQYHEI
jgi:manganese/zinc/iron transport system substrate-binding protein